MLGLFSSALQSPCSSFHCLNSAKGGQESPGVWSVEVRLLARASSGKQWGVDQRGNQRILRHLL